MPGRGGPAPRGAGVAPRRASPPGSSARSRSSSACSASPNAGSPTSSIGACMRAVDVVEHQPRLDRAVPAVGLEADDGADRLAGLRGELRAGAEQHAARAGAAGGERERDVAALASGFGSSSSAAGTSSEIGRLPCPNGASCSSSSASAERQLVAGDDRVDAHLAAQVLGCEDGGGVLGERLAERVDVGRARSSARPRRGGRRGGAGAARPPRRPPSRSKAGIERPEPVPSSPSSAISTAGRWWRSAMRAATIPITPGCQSSAASTYAALRRPARRPAPRRRSGSASRRRGARRSRRRAPARPRAPAPGPR